MKPSAPSSLTPFARRAGFTIVELLVALGVFIVGLTISAYLLTGLQMAPQTRTALTVSQATSQWLESATNVWLSSPSFGNTALLADVPGVNKATWSAQVCEVDTATSPATVTCGAPVSSGKPAYNTGVTTTTATLVRLNLSYTPQGSSAVTTSLEFARR